MSKIKCKKKIVTLLFSSVFFMSLTSCRKPLPTLSSSQYSSSASYFDEEKLPVAPATFVSRTFNYNGAYQSISVSDFTESGIYVNYKITDSEGITKDGNAAIDVGVYKVTASFVSKATNFKVYKDTTATLTITKGDYRNVDPTSVKLASNGVYKYEKGRTYSLEVIDADLLSLFDVTYDETNQNKEQPALYSVKTTFTSKTGNYNSFSLMLDYKIVDDTRLYEVNLINPFEDTNNVISLGFINGETTYKDFFAINKEYKKQADDILEMMNLLHPYAIHSWSFNENDYVRASDAVVIAQAKTFEFKFHFKQGSGISLRNGSRSYVPFDRKNVDKKITVNNIEKTINYVDLVESSRTFNILDLEFNLNGKNILGFYFDKDYQEEIPGYTFTASNFDPDSKTAIQFEDNFIHIFVDSN